MRPPKNTGGTQMHHLEPTNAAEIRAIVEQRLAAVKQADGVQESVTVEWRGQQLSVPVITMPVDLLTYNPLTHRIRAQRSLDASRDHELDDAPFSPASQAYLHQLLMGDPADPSKIDPTFDALKDDLKEHGQNEPGIITRTGVLINGNTRRAALKELGGQHIRVGVLPTDAGPEDILSIELSLQLRKDYKREYSFMNFLLAIDERVRAGYPSHDILSDFRIRSTTLERSQWLLEFIREAIERSTVELSDGTETSLRLVDFETHQGKLEELYRAYMSLKSKSSDDAEALREQRLLALALDKSKTDLRLIEPDFAERYMKQVVPEPVPASEGATARATIPGTNIQARKQSASVSALRDMTTRLLQAKAVIQDPALAAGSTVAEASNTFNRVKEAMEDGLDKAGRNARIRKRRLAPVDRLSDAIEHLELSTAAVSEARSTGNFDPADIDDTLTELRVAMIKLAQVVARSGDLEGEGLEWLVRIAQLDETEG